MNLQNDILNILKELKDNYKVTAIKSEVGSEVVKQDELFKLNEFADNCNLDLAVKIGGCEAVNDIYDAKSAGAKSIIAPMIETPYALRKFVANVSNIQDTSLYINIETITAYANINDILSSDEMNLTSGIILGRDDMASSLGLSDVNSEKLLEIATNLSIKAKGNNKEFIVGGEISPQSIDFLKQIPYLTKFETRKVIFDVSALEQPDINTGILKAIEFEILWLKYRQQFNKSFSHFNEMRIKTLEQRLIKNRENIL